ncbi:class I adenylate-forming enzyme family protein [Sphingosinicella microcystinivorans]|uniref:Acyl-CoA synthetase (AMP-forming)/AMP-acid ligase II n=1 Tax=Sphingosinicella microcystinivorans TaxID=335406 RepID=A0AAD1FYY8_SPHMI|nr:class I adenylate-forming enzyme family protein [Sphingosinicella microcystinivorans]RKS94266.1 acyl-CoA synthetase (AMP-forming)/AMP-acid ligase II [Sphingosinicella microcystinivorans]BBE32382.1 long-chain-fatty-acid--CoA ligase [Sphingosinicella microcystinivorans]
MTDFNDVNAVGHRICDFVRSFANAFPDREALIADGGDRLTYSEYARQVDAVAKSLIAMGVKPGDRVAMLDTPSPRFMVMFAAASGIGAIWMGLNPRYQLGELSYVVGDAQPVLIFAKSRVGSRDYYDDLVSLSQLNGRNVPVIELFDQKDSKFGGYDAFIAAGYAVTDDQLSSRRFASGGRQPCLLVYTSGSTGKPKGALLHHEGIIAFSLEQARLWQVNPHRCLNYFPINHVGCTVDISVPAIVQGGTIVFMEQFDAKRSIEVACEERITWLGSIPSVFALQMACPEWETSDLSAVQLCIWEGAAISEDMLDKLLARFPLLATNYGMTETTSAMAATPPCRDRDMLLYSVGMPFPGVELRILDENDHDVELGEIGEIVARSIYNFTGYLNLPEVTSSSYTNENFFRTGDLGIFRADGTLKISGRIKEMFKSGGYNVYPREVEITLESHPQVDSAVVVCAPDATWQEVGIAFVVANSPLEPDDIISWCRDQLANYKIPKRLVIVDELPLLPIGKVDRNKLKETAKNL